MYADELDVCMHVHTRINTRMKGTARRTKELVKCEYYQPVSVNSVCKEYVATVAPGCNAGESEVVVVSTVHSFTCHSPIY